VILWRISNHSDLEGLGGERANGRWHTAARAKRIVYLSEHPSLALIEVLVNLKGNPRLFPDRYQMLQVTVPADVTVDEVHPGSLVEGGQDDFQTTRNLGDQWLKDQRTALLKVPSAPSPESFNYLLNPNHPDATKVTVKLGRWLRYDRRLFHVQKGP
jgi:RES domain-containing protein